MTDQKHNLKVKLVSDTSPEMVWNRTVFNESKFTEKTQQFILNANIPLSVQRDKQTTANNATITKVGAEYRLRATADTDSKAELESRRRGNYISGNEAEAGMGIRVPVQPTGDAVIRWGYFDDVGGTRTGLYYRYDADGLWVVIENSGTIKKEVLQEGWNIDDLKRIDGKDSGIDPTEGGVYQIRFVYYGYGPIIFEVGDRLLDNKYNMVPVHLEKITGEISIDEPNLPITVEVESGTSGQQLDVYVGGRQFSTYGKQLPVRRRVGDYRIEQGTIGTAFVPCISFREKTGFENILVELKKLTVLSDADLIYEIRVNGTLTGASFDTATNYTASETATEWDTSATAISGGETIKSGLLVGGNKDDITQDDLPDRTVFEDDLYSFCVRVVSGNNATATSFFEVEENW